MMNQFAYMILLVQFFSHFFYLFFFGGGDYLIIKTLIPGSILVHIAGQGQGECPILFAPDEVNASIKIKTSVDDW